LGGPLRRSGKNAREAFDAFIRNLGPQHPFSLDALQQLGIPMAYSHRYPEASKLFRDVIEKQSNAGGQGDHFSVCYSFACGAVAAYHTDDALLYLREALNRGYKDADGLMADNNLKNLRENPHFREIIGELKPPPTKVQTQQCEAASLIRSRFIHHADHARRFGDSHDKGLCSYRGYPESSSSIRFEGVCVRVGHQYQSAGHHRPARSCRTQKTCFWKRLE
jgi:hypothetical protein